jgi:hypothetical protein
MYRQSFYKLTGTKCKQHRSWGRATTGPLAGSVDTKPRASSMQMARQEFKTYLSFGRL